MKYDADFITHKIQMIVGLTAKVQIPPSELEWLLTLEDDYLELGIKQAALNQLRYFDIKPVQQEMLLKQIEERSRQIVMQQKWKEAPMVSYDDYINMSELALANPIEKLHDCFLCKDTGWVCDYSSVRHACYCKKGIEKTAKQVGDKTAIGVALMMQQQNANSFNTVNFNGLLGGMAGAGAAQPSKPLASSISKAPAVVVELPPVVGRKFRGVDK